MMTFFISGAVTGILLTYIYGLVFGRDSTNTGTNETTADNGQNIRSILWNGTIPKVYRNRLVEERYWRMRKALEHINTAEKLDVDALIKALKESAYPFDL